MGPKKSRVTFKISPTPTISAGTDFGSLHIEFVLYGDFVITFYLPALGGPPVRELSSRAPESRPPKGSAPRCFSDLPSIPLDSSFKLVGPRPLPWDGKEGGKDECMQTFKTEKKMALPKSNRRSCFWCYLL